METDFPLNVTDVIKAAIDANLAPDVETVFRPLRTNDPNNSYGIFPVDWGGNQETILMGGPPVPALQRYNYRIHQMMKYGDEQEGRAAFSVAAKKLRVMLYHDRDLAVALGQLAESESSRTERYKRLGIRQQRFLNNELNKQFIFLSATELWVETETIDSGGV